MLNTLKLTQEEIEEAKAWINDCQWRDIGVYLDVEDLSNEEIERGIDKHFNGGLEEFKRTCHE